MADQISRILEKHCEHLRRTIDLMEGGQMATMSNGRDTTQETIVQYRIWASDLDSALAAHKERLRA